MPPPFRTEQIGSLIRPTDLLSHRNAPKDTKEVGATLYADPTTSAAFEAATQDAVKAALATQISLKYQVLSNGEFPRNIFFAGLWESFAGISVHQMPFADFRTGHPSVVIMEKFGMWVRPACVATGKIRWVRSAYLEEWRGIQRALREIATSEEEARSLERRVKVTIPAISQEHSMLKEGKAWTSESGYVDARDFFGDMAAAYREEIKMLYDAGLRNLQIDDPSLSFFVVEEFREAMRADGIDPDERLKLYAWATNQILRDLPSGMHVGVHICRGNLPAGGYISEGSYEGMAQLLFSSFDCPTFYLEYDTERAGDFQPLRYLPKEKNVILGIVSTKYAELEDVDELEARVKDAARLIAEAQGISAEEVLKGQIGISPQCGFASTSESRGVGMTEEVQWEKLVVLQKLARRLWPDENI